MLWTKQSDLDVKIYQKYKIITKTKVFRLSEKPKNNYLRVFIDIL